MPTFAGNPLYKPSVVANPLTSEWKRSGYETEYPKLNGLFTMLEESNSMNQGRINSLKDRLLKLPKDMQVDFLNKIEPTIESNDTETLIRVIRSFNQHLLSLNSKKNGCVVSRKSRKSKSRKFRKSRKN
jgi:hypothetical protein